MRIRAVPDETLENGELEIRTVTWGSGKARIRLGYKGEICFEEEKELEGENTWTWDVKNPELWSAEKP